MTLTLDNAILLATFDTNNGKIERSRKPLTLYCRIASKGLGCDQTQEGTSICLSWTKADSISLCA